MNYVGRFAPSPSGPLHFGSLVAALGSYFQAKSQQGEWLVRIEDLDPPREMIGASILILDALQAFGLMWDREVIYQSQRHDYYQRQIDQWIASGEAYYCQCSRKQIQQAGGYYTGLCRHLGLAAYSPKNRHCSIRINMQQPVNRFIDIKQGEIHIPHQLANEDFIIKRRDGLFAYNLAVVLDDIAQGVTQVVRGADLIEPTGRQISLYKMLNKKPVSYLHLPLAMDKNGNKLSKQNHAKAIDINNPVPTLLQAMRFLGFTLPHDIGSATCSEIVKWGWQNWQLKCLPNEIEITP
jgi:glutamyl-Q tRNA(Asp) synthetase